MLGAGSVVALLFAAAQLDVNGAVATEARAGQAPVFQGLPPQSSVIGIVTPAAEVQVLAPGVDVRAGYSLRIFARETESTPSTRPLFLHNWTLSAALRPTRRLTLKGTGNVMEGEADYTYLPAIYGPGQSSLVVVPRIFALNVQAAMQARATRTTAIDLGVGVIHSEPVGNQAVAGGAAPAQFVLPNFTSVTTAPGVTLRLSPVDELALASILEYRFISPLASFVPGDMTTHSLSVYSVVPTIAWKNDSIGQGHLVVKAGVAFSRLVSSEPVGRNHVSPVAGVLLQRRLAGGRDVLLSTLMEASVDYYVDPVLGTAAPRGLAATTFALALPAEWVVSLRGTVTSTFEAHSRLLADGTSYYPDEVVAAAELAASHRLSPNFLLDLGTRWADRGPFFTAPNAGFHQRQLWFFVRLTGTSRLIPRAAAN